MLQLSFLPRAARGVGPLLRFFAFYDAGFCNFYGSLYVQQNYEALTFTNSDWSLIKARQSN